MSCPSNHIRPRLGVISPEMRRKSVVFPAPFGPMMDRSSPRSTAKSTPSTATRLPNERVSWSVRSRTASGTASDSTRGFSLLSQARIRCRKRCDVGRRDERGPPYMPTLAGAVLLDSLQDALAGDGADRRVGQVAIEEVILDFPDLHEPRRLARGRLLHERAGAGQHLIPRGAEQRPERLSAPGERHGPRAFRIRQAHIPV